jgi:hypothetical protein
VIGPPACGQGLFSALLFQWAVIDSPAATEADSLAGDPGLLQAKVRLFGSLTGRISAHALWMLPPAGWIVVNLSAALRPFTPYLILSVGYHVFVVV